MSLAALFEQKLPVIQAPMAGGVTTPQLVAAVSEAGGLGSFGFAYSTADKIAADLTAAKALTNRPINANFFLFSTTEIPDAARIKEAVSALNSLPISFTTPFDLPAPPFYPDLDAQLEPICANPPAVLSFHFGVPPQAVITRAHSLGIMVGCSATSLSEAMAIEKAGVDFVVAQGIEAGGHRGSFEAEPAEDAQLTTAGLAECLAQHLSIPFVSAGGIMTGGDIQAALRRGASAVQMGTAFLACDEAGTSLAHKQILLHQPERGTCTTRGFSGRLARAIENSFTRAMADQPYLPFPIQNALTAPLRAHASQIADGEYQSLWAGTGYAQARALSVNTLMTTLSAEMGAV